MTVLVILVLACAQEPAAPGHWPQWRGPNRDNVSTEKGLLKAWPEGGPPVSWEVHGIGGGIAAPAVAGGRVFTLGYIGDAEYLSALDEKTGRRLWAGKLGPLVQENPLMRWLGQRTPTVDGTRVYAFHIQGLLACFDAATGKELWRKDYTRDFGGLRSGWGYCDRPLVDGEKLICIPGGKTGPMVALHKATGAIVWKSDSTGTTAHAATVISEAAGVRQYVTCFTGRLVSFRASDGKLLWSVEGFGQTANSCTPIVQGDSILASSGYGVGITLLKLLADGAGVKAERQYAERVDVNPFQDSGLVAGPHFFVVGGSARSCVDPATGRVLWKDSSTGRGFTALTFADGHLYVHHSDGSVALAQPTPEKLEVKSAFKIQEWQPTSGATNSVVAGGGLYLRNDSRLLRYDVRESAAEGARPRPRALVLDPPGGRSDPLPPAQAIYVPTPQDVVEKMLETAGVGKEDVVYDLGSGDGRIVVTAAKKHGARAVGFEIDSQLVRESRANLEKAGVKDLASIESKDMFTVDLAPASVVALYLPEKFLERLLPQLEKLKPGSRIVSHQFKIPGVAPDRSLRLDSKDDGDAHAVFLYATPLKKENK